MQILSGPHGTSATVTFGLPRSKAVTPREPAVPAPGRLIPAERGRGSAMLPTTGEDGDRVTTDGDGESGVAAPAGWQDWRRWVDGVDWSDWRAWLQRVASADWAAGQGAGAPWEQPPRAGEIPLTLRAFAEDEPGGQIRDHLAMTWPAFRQWWRDGANTRPTTAQARARLEEHMPELVPAWQRLTAMIEEPGADGDAGPALALWNPPPFLTGCSQAAVLDGGPALIRNYDWDYRLFDGVVARTAYAGRRVLGMLDCLWGLLDGVSDAGLAVSLTFGGRPQVGEGFGIPLVIRYVLEVCASTEEAVRVLRRVPVHMSYNVTALDAAGQRATVYLAPDRPARVTDLAVVTNHQGRVEWEPYAAAIRSAERLERLKQLLADRADASSVVAACLRPPLYATRFHEGFGTLYTAEYRPAEGAVSYHWPDRTWAQSLDSVEPGRIQIQLGTP
jgi:predicted choloylglycine hydrolase